MDSDTPDDEWIPTFYVGQHESNRTLPVTGKVLEQAHGCNYDMLTSPITTAHFHSRVLALLSNHRAEHGSTSHRDNPAPPPTIPPLTLADTPLTPGDITPQLLAFASSWIDICSPDPVVASISKQVLYLEVAYAAFCGIEYVFIPAPKLYHEDLRTHGTAQYARSIQEALAIGSHLQIFILLPVSDLPEDDTTEEIGSLSPFTHEDYLEDAEESRPAKADCFGTWDAWNLIRTICKYNSRLFVALCLPRQLPPLAIQSRWCSEPVKLISMTNNTFSRNDKGYPVLSRKHQSFISRLMRIKTPPWILLCDVGPIPGLDDPDERVPVADGFLSPSAIRDTLAGGSPTPLESAKLQKSSKKIKDPTPHLNYIRHLQRKQPSRTVAERCGSGFQDFLQIPLQPLTDNLESMTYEVFEKDPVKYDLYEQAIRKALRDWVDQGKPASGPNGCVVLAVAGAGRGPLVTRALRASAAEGVDVEMWAVEKNPNAYVLLQRHNYEDWGSRVNVVKSDMRSWRGPWREDTAFLQSPNIEAQLAEASDPASTPPISVPSPGYTPIDILISELLGSFADNELSPECLDGILHLLNPAHGISIPQSYTSYITPIAAPKLHADIATRTSWDLNAAETPAVVWLHSIDFLSVASIPPDPKAPGQGELIAPPPPAILPVWSFHHGPMQSPPPMPISNSHNTRYARLNFRTRDRGMIHGLAGYFESVLYPGVELSTNPLTMDDKSKDMISWFPIFFPLKTPLYIPDHTALTVSLWRQTDGRKVWYEWMVETWGWNLLVSGEKRKVRLGTSELHSSIKGGCMM